jgi:hypothetical protein
MLIQDSGNNTINTALQKYLYQVATTASELNFFNKVVEFNSDPNDTVSAEASLLMVTYPTVNALATISSSGETSRIAEHLFLLGGVMNFSPNESKQVVPVKEIGSSRKRLVPGPTQYSASLTRLLTAHSNIKYALYQWLFKISNSMKLVRAPGPNNGVHFSGLESEIYKIPFGIINLKATAGGDVIGADFLERCFISSFSVGLTAQSPVVAENINIMITRIVPIMGNYLPTKVVSDLKEYKNTTQNNTTNTSSSTNQSNAGS